MPDRDVLHVGDALALDGLADHRQRLAALVREDGLVDGLGVVTVHLHRLPAEGEELVDFFYNSLVLSVVERYFAIYFKETVGLGVKKHLDYLAGLGLTL